MELVVSFKGMNADKDVKNKVYEKMNLLKSYLDDDAKIKITLWEYDKKKVSDAFVRSGKNEYFAKTHSFDFMESIETLKDKLKTQILKSKNSISKGPRH